MMFVIKAEVSGPVPRTFTFHAQKTMYGGKRVGAGDTIFVFASENEGGAGLIGSGVVTLAESVIQRLQPTIARSSQRSAT